jgi:hypothetical protein
MLTGGGGGSEAPASALPRCVREPPASVSPAALSRASALPASALPRRAGGPKLTGPPPLTGRGPEVC